MTFDGFRDIIVLGAGGTAHYLRLKGTMDMTDMIIKEVAKNTVTVVVERTIRVGAIIRINPSEGYLGIEEGTIRITHILNNDDLESVDSEDHPYAEYLGQIQSDSEVYLDGYQAGDAEYNYLHDLLDSQPWIVYTYTNIPYVSNDDAHILPLHLFIQHTMDY